MERRINLLRQGERYLSQNGVVNSLREAELFLTHVLGCSRLELYLDNLSIEMNKLQIFWGLLNERAKGVPLQYALGSAEFMGLEFKIAPDVFIPRPETEILTEAATNLISYELKKRQRAKFTILDIGTGCGNIAVSIAKSLKNLYIFACDISDSALQLAKKNSQLHQVKVHLVNSDLFKAFKKEQQFSLIISNPPYINSVGISRLPRELRYEPKAALDGGMDGLFYYRRIIDEGWAYLQNNGLLVLEIGDNQARPIKKMLARSQFSLIKVVKDYNRIDRVIVAQRID